MWRWLAESVVGAALASPALAASCTELASCIWICSTQCPALAAGAARSPPAKIVIAGALAAPAMQGVAVAKVQALLPGLCKPAGAGAQLQMLNVQQQATGQALVQASAKPAVALARSCSPLLSQTLRLCEAAAEAELAPCCESAPASQGWAPLRSFGACLC